MSDKIAHLSMIQSVISRHSNSSLQIKCFCIAIASAAVILSEGVIILSCILPVMLFCCLDVYYLQLEKAYRGLYDQVRLRDDSDIDFSMDRGPLPLFRSFASWSIWPFYLSMAVLLIALFTFNHRW